MGCTIDLGNCISNKYSKIAESPDALIYSIPDAFTTDNTKRIEQGCAASLVPWSFDELMQHLQEGPLLAEGCYGPGSYAVEPFALSNKIDNHTVYGWPAAAKRIDTCASVIILGIRRSSGLTHVYFTTCTELTRNNAKNLESGFRRVTTLEWRAGSKEARAGSAAAEGGYHNPGVEKKIYVMSLGNFNANLVGLYQSRPNPSQDSCRVS